MIRKMKYGIAAVMLVLLMAGGAAISISSCLRR